MTHPDFWVVTTLCVIIVNIKIKNIVIAVQSGIEIKQVEEIKGLFGILS